MSDSKSPQEVIELTQERFQTIAPEMSYEAEKGYAMQLLTNNDYLMKVAKESPASLAQAITNVAAINLSLNPAEKLAYLIPRNVKDGNKWVSKIFLEPSYMGLIRLATNSGSIQWCQARCVFSNDKFTFNGDGQLPTHEFNPFAKERGGFEGVYCTAKTNEGDYLTTMLPADEVIQLRDRSEAYKAFKEGNRKSGGPWESDFYEMAKKACIRRAFKTWPLSDKTRIAEAVRLSNENEGYEPILSAPNLGDFTAEQKEYFDSLIESSDALRMFCFSESVNDREFTNLYHSFEKGTKGKYQKVIDELLTTGRNQIEDYVLAIEEAAEKSDSSAIQELVEELPTEAMEILEGKLSQDAAAMLREANQ